MVYTPVVDAWVCGARTTKQGEHALCEYPHAQAKYYRCGHCWTQEYDDAVTKLYHWGLPTLGARRKQADQATLHKDYLVGELDNFLRKEVKSWAWAPLVDDGVICNLNWKARGHLAPRLFDWNVDHIVGLRTTESLLYGLFTAVEAVLIR